MTEILQKNLHNIVCGLVNDAQDVWVKGPAEMGEAFLNICNNDLNKGQEGKVFLIMKWYIL